jgi:hypothetical protein
MWHIGIEPMTPRTKAKCINHWDKHPFVLHWGVVFIFINWIARNPIKPKKYELKKSVAHKIRTIDLVYTSVKSYHHTILPFVLWVIIDSLSKHIHVELKLSNVENSRTWTRTISLFNLGLKLVTSFSPSY